MKKKKKVDASEKEGVCETFEIEKDGKEKIVTACGSEPKKHLSKNQIKNQNKILRNVLIFVGIFFVILIVGFSTLDSVKHFEYRGVEFNMISESNLIFYKTSFPVYYQGQPANYDFYIRNDPRKLKDIEFAGALSLNEFVVMNATEEFNCDGDGTIAIANMVKLFEFLEINAMRDPNASCDAQGRYTFLQIEAGDETKIEQIGVACYRMSVANCEILKVTERMMLETFVEANSVI